MTKPKSKCYCQTCNGSGYKPWWNPDTDEFEWEACPDCKGTGYFLTWASGHTCEVEGEDE